MSPMLIDSDYGILDTVKLHYLSEKLIDQRVCIDNLVWLHWCRLDSNIGWPTG